MKNVTTAARLVSSDLELLRRCLDYSLERITMHGDSTLTKALANRIAEIESEARVEIDLDALGEPKDLLDCVARPNRRIVFSDGKRPFVADHLSPNAVLAVLVQVNGYARERDGRIGVVGLRFELVLQSGYRREPDPAAPKRNIEIIVEAESLARIVPVLGAALAAA
jgi:hypothetical protein